MVATRTVILGVSCDYHDAAAAVVVDGVVVAAVEEERCSRVKHDARLPVGAVEACLELAGVGADQVDHVAFYEKPLTVLARYLASRQRSGPRGARSFRHDVPTLISTNLMVGYRLRRLLRDLGAGRPPVVEYVEHHRSHAAAAFFPSPFDSAAVLTMDGIGEWSTATVARAHRNRIEVLEEMRYPHSLGLLYSFVTAWCGFEPNDGEYKLMGLAPYGTPRFRDALDALARPTGAGGLQVDARRLRWFDPSALQDPGLAELLGGPPRTADAPFGEREADLAASAQALAEDVMLGAARRAFELTDESSLCMAGGVALNCVANGRILREGPFDDLWVQPAAGDGGSAVGAALSLWHEGLDRHRPLRSDRSGPDAMSGGYLGPAASAADVASALDEAGLTGTAAVDEDALLTTVAQRLADGEVVGWFQGRAEFGPRALGNRSILADPRDPTLRTRLNVRVKGRESFRPFAPAVMAEHAGEWFELDHASPYMLVVAPVRAEHLLPVAHEPDDVLARSAVPRSTVPACTHVDGSARIQTVTAESNPRFYALLAKFYELTGCPMLVNTSFNLAGEPIVQTPAQAVRTAREGGMDLLVLGDTLVEGDDLQRGADDAHEVVA